MSRRQLLGLFGAGAAGAAVGAAGGGGRREHARRDVGERRKPPGGAASEYPFHGAHQAGIVTPAQDRLHFAAFDVSSLTLDRAGLIALLTDWTDAAARLTKGLEVEDGGAVGGSEAPPDDTGEALGLPASR